MDIKQIHEALVLNLTKRELLELFKLMESEIQTLYEVGDLNA